MSHIPEDPTLHIHQATIRRVQKSDNMEQLTKLIHSAYGQHAAQGLRYWGTHQSVDDTVRRFQSGEGLLAEMNGEYVGTVVVRPPSLESPVLLYREPTIWSISQFAVAPQYKGQGLGKRLHQLAVDYALAKGANSMALDTAKPAVALIALYRGWGYELVGEHDWRPHTNYVSVLMRRSLVKTISLYTTQQHILAR